MRFPLDHSAIVGYSLILLFSLIQLPTTFKNPIDFVANILLLVGLTALIVYHVRKVDTKKDETDSEVQKYTRVVAHSSLVAFLLLTLSSLSKSKFRFYDGFALLAHTILLITVLNGMNQIAGVGLLALYFLFASFNTATVTKGGSEVILLIGRIVMLVFFSISFVQGI